MTNLSWPQVALTAFVLAALLGAHYLGATALETTIGGALGIVVAGLMSLGKKADPPEGE